MMRHHTPMFEFKHKCYLTDNNSYISRTVKEHTKRGLSTIVLDPTKLKMKVYTGTNCYLFDRNGDPLLIRSVNSTGLAEHGLTLTISSPKPVIGHSKPHLDDRFNKYDGRKFALLNALNKVIFTRRDSNFEELLFYKKFIKTFELKSNIDSISWEFADLWQALVNLDKAKETNTSIHEAYNYLEDKAKLFSGEDLFDKFTVELGKFISSWDSYIDIYGQDLEVAYFSYKLFLKDFIKDN